MALQWYPKYTGDYARKTAHLNMSEHGAYNLLLDCYYSAGALPKDKQKIYIICRAFCKKERNIVDYILTAFFKLTKNGYINPKADETIEKQTLAHEKRVKAGRKGGKQCLSKKVSNAKAMLKQPEPEPEPDSITSNTKYISEFEMLWKDYPNTRAKGVKNEALKKYVKIRKKGIAHEAVREGLGRYAAFCKSGNWNKHFTSWLNQRGWEEQWDCTVQPCTGANNKTSSRESDTLINAASKARELLQMG